MATVGGAKAYFPILKWKMGEQGALKPLTTAQKQALLPIAELQDRPYDWQLGKYRKSWDKHIQDVAKATAKYWGSDHEIAFDQPLLKSDELSGSAGTTWEYLFAQLWAAGVDAVPVLSSEAGSDEVTALRTAVAAHNRSRWVLRFVLDPDAPPPSAANVAKWFFEQLVTLGIAAGRADAVIDVAHVGAWEVKTRAVAVAQWLSAVAAIGPWRNLVLASGAFPENLAGVPKGTKQIERKDWELFVQTRKATALKTARLVFGDYGISHVAAFDEDPRMLKMSANLRYAHWTHWHVIKGSSVKDYGFDQYRDLCKVLTALPIFMNATFSHGDTSYDDVANNPAAKTGNATIWRRDATNHHVHVVLSQVASLPAP